MTNTIDLDVDYRTLQESWASIPDDVLTWGKQLAEAKKKELKAKLHADVTYAKICVDIRQNPTAYGYAKVTEDAIKQRADMDPAVVAAIDAHIDAYGDMVAIKAVVDALDVKRSALKYTTELTLNTYNGSSDNIPSGIRGE